MHQKNYSHVDFLPLVISKRLSLSNKFRFKLEKEHYVRKKEGQILKDVVSTVNINENGISPLKIVCLKGINLNHNGETNNIKGSRFYIPEKINFGKNSSNKLNNAFNVSRNDKLEVLNDFPSITKLKSSIETEKFLTLNKMETTARSGNILETKRNVMSSSDEKMLQTINSSISRSKSRYFPNSYNFKTFEMKFKMIVKTSYGSINKKKIVTGQNPLIN